MGAETETVKPMQVPPRKGDPVFGRRETISHERAQEAATRLIHSHFGHEPHARISIPVNADDDDVIICEYIKQQIEKEMGFREPQLAERWLSKNSGSELPDPNPQQL